MSTKKYFAQRAVSVEESIRTRMLQLASQLENIIPLGRGDPDFDTPRTIVRGGVRALNNGLHHYTAPAGMPELREAVSDELSREKGLDYSARQVIVCNGCQEALFITILALVDPGDEVILQAPRFDAFDYMVNLAGGRVVTVPTREEDNFALRAVDVSRVITDKTKLLVVANPNNPTGALIAREELAKIAELAVENDLLVASDEVYDKNGMKKRKDIWIEWWKHGRKEDVKRFDNLYKKLRKSIEKKKVRDSDSAKNAIQDLGVNVLPLIVAKIRDGDIDLIECVSVLTSNEVSKNASKKDVLVWWEKNKGRWLLSFKDQ